jgi:hypothetical protein
MFHSESMNCKKSFSKFIFHIHTDINMFNDQLSKNCTVDMWMKTT